MGYTTNEATVKRVIEMVRSQTNAKCPILAEDVRDYTEKYKKFSFRSRNLETLQQYINVLQNEYNPTNSTIKSLSVTGLHLSRAQAKLRQYVALMDAPPAYPDSKKSAGPSDPVAEMTTTGKDTLDSLYKHLFEACASVLGKKEDMVKYLSEYVEFEKSCARLMALIVPGTTGSEKQRMAEDAEFAVKRKGLEETRDLTQAKTEHLFRIYILSIIERCRQSSSSVNDKWEILQEAFQEVVGSGGVTYSLFSTTPVVVPEHVTGEMLAMRDLVDMLVRADITAINPAIIHLQYNAETLSAGDKHRPGSIEVATFLRAVANDFQFAVFTDDHHKITPKLFNQNVQAGYLSSYR